MTWQPIETMPEYGAYFVWAENLGTVLLREAWAMDKDYEVFSEIGLDGGEIFGALHLSHWMPLPAPPEDTP